MKKGTTCYRPRKDGERKRKSVRGCIVDGNLSVLSMAIIKKGEAEVITCRVYFTSPALKSLVGLFLSAILNLVMAFSTNFYK